MPRTDGFDYPHDELILALAMTGAADEALRWSRARGDLAERATALFDFGAAIQAPAKVGRSIGISNGPDMCREEF